MTREQMTSRERSDLLIVARQRARVAKVQVAQRAAELRADFEAQLAAVYAWDSTETWAHAKAMVDQVERTANALILEEATRLGIPNAFAPSIHSNWYGRGENASASRRSELRKVATTGIEALSKEAVARIEAASLKVQERLLADGLTSDAAQEFLLGMPSVSDLMPTLNLPSLEAELLR
jgi:hypothetical protein